MGLRSGEGGVLSYTNSSVFTRFCRFSCQILSNVMAITPMAIAPAAAIAMIADGLNNRWVVLTTGAGVGSASQGVFNGGPHKPGFPKYDDALNLLNAFNIGMRPERLLYETLKDVRCCRFSRASEMLPFSLLYSRKSSDRFTISPSAAGMLPLRLLTARSLHQQSLEKVFSLSTGKFASLRYFKEAMHAPELNQDTLLIASHNLIWQ